MNIAAFVISLISGILSFLQGGCASSIGSLGAKLGRHVGDYGLTRGSSALGGAGSLVVLAAIMAIIGGSLALPRKKASYIVLGISSGMCFLAYAITNGFYSDSIIWGIAYALSAVFAYIGCQKNNAEVSAPSIPATMKPESWSSGQPAIQNNNHFATTNNQANNNNQVNTENNTAFNKPVNTITPQKIFTAPTAPINPPKITPPKINPALPLYLRKYEPIVGVATENLVKRGFLFLDDGNFHEADRYFEQALNQDAENSQAYLGKSMAIRNLRSVDDLINLQTPVADEKFFRRAMRFADAGQMQQLEGYIKANNEKRGAN